MVGSKDINKSPYETFYKRTIDIVAAGLIILVFSWLYFFIALVVLFNLGSPVIFTQNRTGRNGKTFRLYKFRSMSNKQDDNGNLLPDKMRLNTFGRVLRSTSLDELPEMFNIIKGDMSIVGPRPLLPSYLKHYNSIDNRRHEVRPGLTGLAQISGRNGLSWKDKFQKDVEYVDHLSFSMDLKIVLMTIKKVFVREGIEFEEGHQSIMEYFEESKQEG